jgi:hypothetical protein
VLDAEDFERQLKLVNLAHLMAEAEANVQTGCGRIFVIERRVIHAARLLDQALLNG